VPVHTHDPAERAEAPDPQPGVPVLLQLVLFVTPRSRLLLALGRWPWLRLAAFLGRGGRRRRVRGRWRVDVRVRAGRVHDRALDERQDRAELARGDRELRGGLGGYVEADKVGPCAAGECGDLAIDVVRGEQPGAEDALEVLG
jgi:hypothetical protein